MTTNEVYDDYYEGWISCLQQIIMIIIHYDAVK